MADFVFYCPDCKRTFVGQDYLATERPRCPRCDQRTFPAGLTKELWLQKSKGERQEILDALADAGQNAPTQGGSAQTVGVTDQKTEEAQEGSILDKLYANIGQKIKRWAMWSCVVEAFAAIVCGVGMMADDQLVPGLILVLLGPLAAWVSSWILYAFGELVEKTVTNEQNTSKILKLMQENKDKQDKD